MGHQPYRQVSRVWHFIFRPSFTLPALRFRRQNCGFPSLEWALQPGCTGRNKQIALYFESANWFGDQGSLDDPRAEMKGWFELKTNEKGVLSLSLFNYAYTGGAHGVTLQHSYTFDIASGKTYSLADLFKPGSAYVKRLSDLIRVQIESRRIATLEPFRTILPNQPFYIADRALVIYFPLFELTPYAFGFLFSDIGLRHCRYHQPDRTVSGYGGERLEGSSIPIACEKGGVPKVNG